MNKRIFGVVALVGTLFMGGNFAQAQNAPTVNFCSGGEGGNYQNVAMEIAAQAKGNLTVNVLGTKGSWENLELLTSGKCQVAIVQNDALRVWASKNPSAILNIERAGNLYKEYVHLVCNRESKITRITELNSSTTVAIGKNGSGVQVTWDSFILADKKKYSAIPTVPLDGLRALEKVKAGSDVTCMVYTAGLGAPFMKNDVNGAGSKVRLARADDRDFDNAKDEKGKAIYSFQDIPGGTYKAIQDGAFSSSVSTVAVDSILIVSSDWIDANERAYSNLIRAKVKTEPWIKAKIGE